VFKRWYDPINQVWMRVIPNSGMSFAEWDAEQDRIISELITNSPALEEFVLQVALARAWDTGTAPQCDADDGATVCVLPRGHVVPHEAASGRRFLW